VDDNATNRRILYEVLRHWRMQPTAAENGHTALRMLQEARQAGAAFPLVLLDALMPEMDGFTVVARIKQEPALAGATILMLSSAELPEQTARCHELDVHFISSLPVMERSA